MMPWIELFENPLVLRLGRVLLHFVWQGALLALVWGGLRYLLRRHDARIRYGVACLLFVWMAAAPVVTFRMMPTMPSPRVTLASSDGGDHWVAVDRIKPESTASAGILLAQGAAIRATAGIELALPWLVLLWWAGVCGLSMRLLHGYWSLRRVASRHTRTLTAEWDERFRELQRRLRMSRPVLLLESALIEVPAVIGWFRPMVLVPASSLSGLTPAQLELILAHELAHIRRHDHWVNLFQVLIETVLFYHPAVWWLSRDIRRERELCCDDLAVATCGNRLAYARALSALEGLRHRPEAMAIGADGGSLLERIRRIVGVPTSESAVGWRQPVGGALLGLGLLLFAGGIGCIALSAREYTAVCRVVSKALIDAWVQPWMQGRSGEASAPDSYFHSFLQTEVARMRSRPLLTEVAGQLGLASHWGSPTRPLGMEEVLRRMWRQLEIRRIPDSPVIEIRFSSRARENAAQEAAEIANKIAAIYQETRLQMQAERAQRGVQELEEQLRAQDRKVREAQALVDELQQRYDISDMSPDGSPASLLEPETVRRLASELIAVEAAYIGQSNLLANLKDIQKRGTKDLRHTIQTASPDQELAKLLNDLWTTDAELARMRELFGPEHPDYRSTAAMHAKLETTVNERIQGIFDGMELRAASLRKQVQSLNDALDQARKQESEMTERYRDYFLARRDLENQQKLRDAILLRKLQESVDAKIPRRSIVEIIEPAVPSDQPVRPRLGLGLALCAAGMLSSLGGVVVRHGRPAAAR